jgi:hypothetical protein
MDSLLAVWQLELNGHELQASKQLIGDKAEFLRITYDIDGVKGNLCRSIGSFVGPDMQSPNMVHGLEYVKGTGSAIAGLWRRGADKEVCKRLMLICGEYFAQIQGDDESKTVLRNLEWLFVSERSGGYGMPILGEVTQENIATVGDVPTLRSPSTRPGTKDYGVSALMGYAQKRFELSKLHTDELALVEEDAKRATYQGALDVQGHKDWVVQTKEWQRAHIDRCNASKPVVRKEFPAVPREILSKVDAIVSDFALAESKDVRSMNAIDLEELADAAISTSLGLLGTSRGILTQLRDAGTGEKLGALTAMERLSPDRAAYKQVLSLAINSIDEEYATWLLRGNSHILNDNGGLVASEVQPLLYAVHYQVFPDLVQHLGKTRVFIDDAVGYVTVINTQIIRSYINHGLWDRYRF